MAIVEKEIFAPADVEASKVVKKKQPVKADIKVTDDKYVEGLVISTGNLNVRKEPSLESNPPIGILARGEVVKVNVNKSNVDWAFVEHDNIEGFCMKKFIKINK